MSLLKVARTKKELTQIQMAEVLGVSRQQVSNYESRRQSPPIEKLRQIAKAYGVTVEELVEHFTVNADQ